MTDVLEKCSWRVYYMEYYENKIRQMQIKTVNKNIYYWIDITNNVLTSTVMQYDRSYGTNVDGLDKELILVTLGYVKWSMKQTAFR